MNPLAAGLSSRVTFERPAAGSGLSSTSAICGRVKRTIETKAEAAIIVMAATALKRIGSCPRLIAAAIERQFWSLDIQIAELQEILRAERNAGFHHRQTTAKIAQESIVEPFQSRSNVAIQRNTIGTRARYVAMRVCRSTPRPVQFEARCLRIDDAAA